MKNETELNPNALYLDKVSGRKFARIRRILSIEEVEVLISDGRKMLALKNEPDYIYEIGEEFARLSVDKVAVELNTGKFRHMDDIVEINYKGEPVT